MWLFIDTHVLGTYRLGFVDQHHEDIQSFSGRAHELLGQLDRLCPDTSLITGICVVDGPGTFSSIRTGVLYANLLARLLSVPLTSIHAGERFSPLDVVSRSYVAPIYDSEPNITYKTTC
jgi:tRNA A37 threonylcarbamoyladenosine modification protein TsaB